MNKVEKSKLYMRIVTGAFLLVPVFSSLISTVHAVSLFSLGNKIWMAIALAIVFELGQLSSLMTLAVLDKINKVVIWSIFIVLALMQIMGNVYYTYDFISGKMLVEPTWLKNALELINHFTYNELKPATGKLVLSLVIGLPIPLISIAFLKSLTDYLKPDTIFDDGDNTQHNTIDDDTTTGNTVADDAKELEKELEKNDPTVDLSSLWEKVKNNKSLNEIWETEKQKENDAKNETPKTTTNKPTKKQPKEIDLGKINKNTNEPPDDSTESNSHTPYINN